MIAYTEICIDIETGKVLWWKGNHYTGEVAECKRSQAKQLATGQINLGDQMAQMITNLQKNLTAPAASALNTALGNALQGIGFNPAALSSMRSSAIQGVGNAFNSAEQNLRTMLASRGLLGGSTPSGGLTGQGLGSFEAQRAGTLSQDLNNINLANAQQANSNLFNASQGLGGLASIFNPSPYTGLAEAGLGARTNLETAPTVGSNLLSSWLSPKTFGFGQ